MSILIACPKCESNRTIVLEARAHRDNAIRRRRQCRDCNYRFTTIEAVDTPPERAAGRAA